MRTSVIYYASKESNKTNPVVVLFLARKKLTLKSRQPSDLKLQPTLQRTRPQDGICPLSTKSEVREPLISNEKGTRATSFSPQDWDWPGGYAGHCAVYVGLSNATTIHDCRPSPYLWGTAIRAHLPYLQTRHVRTYYNIQL